MISFCYSSHKKIKSKDHNKEMTNYNIDCIDNPKFNLSIFQYLKNK